MIKIAITILALLTAQPNLNDKGWEINLTPNWSAKTQYVYKDFNKHQEITSSLNLRCNAKGFDIYFEWGKFMGDMKKKVPIMFQVDNQKPFSDNWKITSGYVTMATYSTKKKIAFLKKIIEAKTLKTRVAPFGTKVLVSDFNVGNTDSIIENIKNNCPVKERYWEK